MAEMKILFNSLGCDKNLVDSEYMLGLITQEGYRITDDESEADVVVINTCCFIHDAKEESIQAILEAAELKKTAVLKLIIVTGCLAERYRDEIIKEIPEVDAVIGANAYDEIVNVIKQIEDKELTNKVFLKDKSYLPLCDVKRINSTGGHYSYLKIAEGCNKHCTYCVIPSIKGSYRSIPMDRLMNEAESLASEGVRELIVIAQETTIYGTDICGRKMLPELLKKLCSINGIRWIRLMYCYPEEINDELIDVIASEPKICKYIDLPVQHASDSVLRRMGRRTSKKELQSIILKLRERIPGIIIRTSLITGFPGETEEEHEELLGFVKEMRFERLGVFTYSKEEDTPAAHYKGQINKKLKSKRKKDIMLEQQKYVFERNRELAGNIYEVMIDGRLTDEDVYIGRTYMDAPGIDGYIFVKDENSHVSGDLINVVIEEADNYDLIGSVYEPEEEKDELTK